jgi:hypothetical protein
MKNALAYQYAICISNADYPASLEVHKVYRVLPDKTLEEGGDLRVVDESGEDYIYPAEYFLIVPLPEEVANALQSTYL